MIQAIRRLLPTPMRWCGRRHSRGESHNLAPGMMTARVITTILRKNMTPTFIAGSTPGRHAAHGVLASTLLIYSYQTRRLVLDALQNVITFRSFRQKTFVVFLYVFS